MALLTGILTGGSNNHETTSEEANAVATDFIGEGIVSTVANTSGVAPATGGFAVNAQGTPDMTVAVSSGVAYVTGTPTSQNSQQFRVKNSATENVTISANASGSTKYDWVYISLNATNLNTPNTAGDNVATLTTSRSSSASTDDGTPPTYGLAIAVVTVANGETAITNGMIRDVRVQCGVSAGATTATSTWTDTGYAPGTVTYNGNRSYQCVFSNTDLTGFLSNGMRLKLTRTTAPPTQCTDLESGSSQYWSKTSPAGTTFTDDFCAGAWIKLESYTGANQVIISRYNGTSGWRLELNSSNQVRLIGLNGGASNNSYVESYQSIPLNKWVHIAAQLDMSAFTATTTTSYVMIDGVSVPCSVARGGTNPTALVQAGDLQVGTANSVTPLDGKIAQAWYSNAKITQATIQTFISQGMTGSETSIVSHFDFNGDANDNNANANNLSANGGAGFVTDSPFNATEYGIITANTFSTNTTLTVQVPEGYSIPTTGGVSAVSYSTQDVPYGFPRNKNKWTVENVYIADQRKAAPAASTWYSGSATGSNVMTVPVGAWLAGYSGNLSCDDTAVTQVDATATLSTANNSESNINFSSTLINIGASGAMRVDASVYKRYPLELTSATPYYLNVSTGIASANNLGFRCGGVTTNITAELAYI